MRFNEAMDSRPELEKKKKMKMLIIFVFVSRALLHSVNF